MNRQKFLLVAFVPAMAMIMLSACNPSTEQSQAQGSLNSAADAAQQSDTLPPLSVTEAAADDAAPVVGYADVVNVKPVTSSEKIIGTVTNSEELVQTSTTPKEVCKDVVVQERLPEKDGNVGGTVLGAVIGGVVGNQIGGGSGKKLATVGGAVAGGMIGNKIDKNKENGQIVSKTETQCHTENVSTSKVTGYQITYRLADGSTGGKRMDSGMAVGSKITLGSTQKTVGYDVTYSYEGQESTVRMDRKPGDQLPVIDGRVVLDSKPVSKN